MISGVLKPEKIVIHSLYICPPHLYIVATLPWEIRKSFFSNIIHTRFLAHSVYAHSSQQIPFKM